MKIWQLKSLFDNYQSFQLLNLKEDRKKYFDGKIDLAIKLSDSWGGGIFIECVEGDKKSDCPMFWGELGTPMISRKAKEILEPLICNNVEFLPLIHDVTSEVYYLINVLNTVDAINYNKAVLENNLKGFEFVEVWDSEEGA
ncbi:hypothetical protein ACTFSO_19190 [Bacillus cereus group sp. MYBK120-1]|uniref:hypothetical protein n=1 Tax=Bacillus cereus group sp. MYBK120-1 TaxID=3450691 RepID=UPI003F7A93AE